MTLVEQKQGAPPQRLTRGSTTRPTRTQRGVTSSTRDSLAAKRGWGPAAVGRRLGAGCLLQRVGENFLERRVAALLDQRVDRVGRQTLVQRINDSLLAQ